MVSHQGRADHAFPPWPPAMRRSLSAALAGTSSVHDALIGRHETGREGPKTSVRIGLARDARGLLGAVERCRRRAAKCLVGAREIVERRVHLPDNAWISEVPTRAEANRAVPGDNGAR